MKAFIAFLLSLVGLTHSVSTSTPASLPVDLATTSVTISSDISNKPIATTSTPKIAPSVAPVAVPPAPPQAVPKQEIMILIDQPKDVKADLPIVRQETAPTVQSSPSMPSVAPTPTPISTTPATPSSPPPTVSLTANGQKTAHVVLPDPSINYSDPLVVQYRAQNVARCMRSEGVEGWSGTDQGYLFNSKTFGWDSLSGGTYVFSVSCYDAAGTEVDDSVTVTVDSLPSISCPQSLVIGETTYSLEPCSLDVVMTDGNGTSRIDTMITTTNATSSYSYSASYYGVGFPAYSVSANQGGGVTGNVPVTLKIDDGFISAKDGRSKTYSGYYPIKVSDWNGHSGYLYFKMNLTVNPGSSL